MGQNERPVYHAACKDESIDPKATELAADVCRRSNKLRKRHDSLVLMASGFSCVSFYAFLGQIREASHVIRRPGKFRCTTTYISFASQGCFERAALGTSWSFRVVELPTLVYGTAVRRARYVQ